MEMTPLAPPSVQLVPAKEYTGAPIGTSYDVRAYVAERPEEKVNRRSMVRMGIRVLHMAPGMPHPSPAPPPAPVLAPAPQRPPHAAVDKPFLLSDGKVELEASLNKAVYNHGETVMVNVAVHNNSSRSVRRIKVFVVQHVDVCMFSNGKFKNVVALINSRDQCPLGPGGAINRAYALSPEKGTTKNWIALEDSFARGGAPLASTVTCASNSPDDRNVFAIYVSYYVKVKLLVGAMGGELSVKLPFTLMHSSYDSDLPCLSSVPCCTDGSKALNGGTDTGEQAENGGTSSRRTSSVNTRRLLQQQQQQGDQTAQQQRRPSEDGQGSGPGGKAKMAQQMRDADVIMTCDDEGGPTPGAAPAAPAASAAPQAAQGLAAT
ncbi:arrestin homolog [Frankliniella occidentalis]|uniref:Arrestin homolog n=1 Tax=Frankliniella occidentalis TaxID=133901 RepID=A0A9C6UE67_FRAOC|nr:arrestin homolog [Frankliniella occidentalis]